MEARTWKLPGVQDLTKDQEAALAYSTQGQHLIIGGPGTGKTVVMVMRAKQLEDQGAEYVFLVYNHMLHQASQQMAGKQFKSSTYLSWFYKKFRNITGESVPQLKPYSPDWKACVREILADNVIAVNKLEFLLIDEGQDMSPSFYQTLVKLGYENFFVAADQNQQITADDNSSRKDLEDELAIDTRDVIELKYNFRNNYGVALLARAFYTGDPASPPPELPDRKRRLHAPKLYTFENRQGRYKQIAEAIVKFGLRDRQKLIGVITPNNNVRERYMDALEGAADSLAEVPLNICTYDARRKQQIRFDRGGIVVLNARSCKGLEFDTVILADIDEHNISRDHKDATKKLFYVMISRARDKVFLLMKRDRPSLIRDILPEDESVLHHKPLPNYYA